MSNDYQFGLLYLVHLLVSADGVIDDNERTALQHIKKREGISDEIFAKFEHDIKTRKERDIYQTGIERLNNCSDDEKLKAFVLLYKMSEVDGRVHVKEVRLLLYSIKMAGIEFDDVVSAAANAPSL
ncbi:MAG: TerB family tellurite resistance protein [Flammeovirgaceae bacterium]|nr:MAG: TerB family tellurite resistance protein [Flammeovirgaceae bacterium]